MVEGKGSIVTVSQTAEGRWLASKGLRESGVFHRPPYGEVASVLLGVVPYLAAEEPRRALVIGLVGGITVKALTDTAVESIEVVELEEGVARAVEVLHEGRVHPLADPRVELRLGGRSQRASPQPPPGSGALRSDRLPAEPSLAVGAANLFTEEYFRLARERLAEGEVFAAWVNGFRSDAESFLAVVASFERVFPGASLLDCSPSHKGISYLLVGAREPLRLDLATVARRMAEPWLASRLALYDIRRRSDLLARFEGPAAAVAAVAAVANTDDNAFVETRIPRRLAWRMADFNRIEAGFEGRLPVLPPLEGSADVAAIARHLLGVPARGGRLTRAKVERLLRHHGDGLEPGLAEVLRGSAGLLDPATERETVARLRSLAEDGPGCVEALRALGRHFERRRDLEAAGEAFGEAFAASGRLTMPLPPPGCWRWRRPSGPGRGSSG